MRCTHILKHFFFCFIATAFLLWSLSKSMQRTRYNKTFSHAQAEPNTLAIYGKHSASQCAAAEKLLYFLLYKWPAAYDRRSTDPHAQMIELTILSKSNIRSHILMLMCEITVLCSWIYAVQLQFSELKSKVALRIAVEESENIVNCPYLRNSHSHYVRWAFCIRSTLGRPQWKCVL